MEVSAEETGGPHVPPLSAIAVSCTIHLQRGDEFLDAWSADVEEAVSVNEADIPAAEPEQPVAVRQDTTLVNGNT